MQGCHHISYQDLHPTTFKSLSGAVVCADLFLTANSHGFKQSRLTTSLDCGLQNSFRQVSTEILSGLPLMVRETVRSQNSSFCLQSKSYSIALK